MPNDITLHDLAINGDSYKVAYGFRRSDEGNAQRLVFYFGDIIRYVSDVNAWFIWSGVKWTQDIKGEIFERAKDTVRLIRFESNFVKEMDAEKKRKEVIALDNWAYQSEAMKKIKAMVELAKTDPRIAVERKEFNANPHLKTFPNGTLDFENRVFREHRKEDLITQEMAVPYNPTKTSKEFYQTLDLALPEDEAINLQRRLGLAFEATTKNKELILTYGKQFSCKSSVTQAVYKAMGDYAKHFEWSLLGKSRHGISSNAARPELVVLEDAVIAWSEEIPDGMVFDDATVRSFTSSGDKEARGLYEKQRTIRLRATFCLETNGAPNIDIVNDWNRDAVLERIGVTPFLNTIPKEKRDRDVFKHLTEDKDELTVALAWAIQGYFDRIDHGLLETENVLESAARFEADTNPLSPFVESQILFDNGTREGSHWAEVYCSVADMYERFKETSERELLDRFKNQRSFNIQLKRALAYYSKKAGVKVENKKRNFGSIWTNLRLSEISDDIEADEVPRDEGKSDAKLESDAKYPIWCNPFMREMVCNTLHQNTSFASPNGKKLSYPIVKIGLGASILESDLYKERVYEVTQSDAK